MPPQVINLLLTSNIKAKAWELENEYRLAVIGKNGLVDLGSIQRDGKQFIEISKIIFGCQMSINVQKFLHRAYKTKGFNFPEATKDPKKLKITIQSYKVK